MMLMNRHHRALLIRMQVGGCTCMTKTNVIQYHATDCQYRLAGEIEEVLTFEDDTAPQSSQPVDAGEAVKHVGNSNFEGWYQEYAARITGNPKQTARDAYAAGLNEAEQERSTGICFFCGEPIDGKHESDCPQATATQPAQTEQALTDGERLDWLDSTNKPFKMGWRVGVAPAGNVSVGSVIQLGDSITPIRAAIDAAIAAAQPASGDAQ